MINNKCVVSFADRTGSYQKKMLRLEQSLKGNFDGDFLGFTDYNQIGSPRHSEIPYAFKPYAIQKAIDLGYEQILWCDSCVYAKKSMNYMFRHLNTEGYLFFDNIGHSLGDWSKDKTLKYFGISRDDAFNIKSIMACVMGFNMAWDQRGKFTMVHPTETFKEYKELAPEFYPGNWDNDDGSVSSDMRVKGSRHDQEIMSAIIHRNKLQIIKGQDTFFCYEEHRKVMPISDTVCLFSAG